jgi:hypothetical protein
MSKQPKESLASIFLVPVVSLYLLIVGTWLIVTGRIPSPGFTRIALARFKHPYEGALSDFRQESGYCWVSPLPTGLLSDLDSVSSLQLYEDGIPLDPAHSAHDAIRLHGAGRFSHWGSRLYLSSSDNTSPAENGRRYTVREIR